MKLIHIYIALLMVLLVASCDESYFIDEETTEPKVVIEGLITPVPELNFIRLTRSRGFYASGVPEAIIDAVVTVTDDQGNERTYLHNPENKPEKDGVYYPEVAYGGQIGSTYSLSVDVNGEVFTAMETMMPLTAIDSLTVELDEEEKEDPEDEGRFYEVLFYAKEPQETKDYYLFKFYRNGELVKEYEEEINFSDDTLLGENISGLSISGYYAIDDVVKVEMYSLTRDAFVYYNDLYNLINSDGGMYAPPPANPRSNLSNGALGYFQVSALQSKEIVVSEPGN